MNIKAYKTHKILAKENLFEIIDKYLPLLSEKSVVAVSSKIIGICEGRVVALEKDTKAQKDELVKKESQYYIPRDDHYGFMLTINHNALVGNAGIDESNANGFLAMWPADPQKSVNEIREYLVKKNNIQNVGVIMTDSKLSPLRYGVTGYSIAHSGFKALNSYVDQPDIFGRLMKVEKANMPDSLASASVAVMGEGNEQQPLAVITDVPFVQFQSRNPSDEELEELKIKLEDDIFSSLLTKVAWEKGEK